MWDACLPDPANRFSFFCFDLPGFGNSPLPQQPFSVDSVADTVFRDISTYTSAPPVVIGHSLGGYVALAMAAREPKALAGLCLFHSTALADTAEKKQNREKVAASVRNYGARPFLETFAAGLFADSRSAACTKFSERCTETSAESIAAWALAMRDRPDRTALLKAADIPITWVAGRFDTITPVEMMEMMRNYNMTMQLELLENSAHAGMLEEPAEASAIIARFLSSIP